MIHKPKRHPKNVPGDFYIEDGCCTACDVPGMVAPGLTKFTEDNSHCYVVRQPTTEKEVSQAIDAIYSSDLECIRYAGKDLNILERLSYEPESCDNRHYILRISPLLRNHVTFEYLADHSEAELAQQLKDYILNLSNGEITYKAGETTEDESGTTFSFGLNEPTFYSVWFKRLEAENIWHVFHSPDSEKTGSKGVSLLIDDWLRSSEDFNYIKWYTAKNWNKFLAEWQSTIV